MKFGVKTYYNRDFLEYFKKNADFFEVMAIQGKDYAFLKEFSIPIIIHSEHNVFGINFADLNKFKRNLESINFARKVADISNAEKIIFHLGIVENNSCSEENAISFIKKVKDDRFIIENSPKKVKEGFLCNTPKEVKRIKEKLNTGFCLDISHAIVTANLLKRDYIGFLKEFIKLNPSHYHFGGQKIIEKEDSHLSFEDSDLSIKETLKLLPENAEITLETQPDIQKVENDLKIIRENYKIVFKNKRSLNKNKISIRKTP